MPVRGPVKFYLSILMLNSPYTSQNFFTFIIQLWLSIESKNSIIAKELKKKKDNYQ